MTSPQAVKRPRSGTATGPRSAVTVARGDGIGPEIMEQTIRILAEAGAKLDIEEVRIGRAVYEAGHTSGMEPGAWDSLRRTGVFLKGPITTPQGGGYKSLNVTTRKTLGLFANVRPCVSYAPFVRTHHPKIDLVIVRENEEDLYAGIEHRQTQEVYQCLKLISRPGSERLIRYAFEHALRQGRRRLTCMTKDNIMKLTDGLFHQVFDEVAAEYQAKHPELETEHLIIDIGAARVADSPERFDVIVTSNLYGDIISDIAAQVAGSVGLAPSANVGRTAVMYEAIHGSAPDIAGQDKANPSGLLLAAVMMLEHLGQCQAAARVHNAWLKAIEDGNHTGDIHGPWHQERGLEPMGTRAFGDAVIARLGQSPQLLKAIDYGPDDAGDDSADLGGDRVASPAVAQKKELVGVDIFLHWDESGRDPNILAERLKRAAPGGKLSLKLITNRGVKVWPEGMPETFCADHWRCRFTGEATIDPQEVLDLLGRIHRSGLEFIKIEKLYQFDGQPGYSLGQGE